MSTSCLAYSGLCSAAILAKELGKMKEHEYYNSRANMLNKAIDDYFVACVEGFDTYRYYDGNENLMVRNENSDSNYPYRCFP